MTDRLEIEINEYHRDWEYLSPSKLEMMASRWDRGEPIFSPHVFKAHQDGLIPFRKSDAMDLGSLVDAAITEPDTMPLRFQKGPCEDRRVKLWKDAQAAAEPATLIQPSLWDAATSMCLAFQCNLYRPKDAPVARQPTYRFERKGIKLKCRPDLEFAQQVCEIKTTRHVTITEWVRDAFAYGYHRQAAVQRWGAVKPIWHFVISSQPPYPCWAFQFTDDQLLVGERQVDLLLEKYRDCRDFCDWSAPGSADFNVMQAPLWILPDSMQNEIVP